MEQAIIGFHQDDKQDWVAELICGHNQHVRHNPPWCNRPWVVQEKTRLEKIGALLNCIKCEENAPRDHNKRI